MSHNRTSRVRSRRSQLLSVPLRLKIVAGVVVVTLLTLASFDVGAIIATRRYQLTQTDNNLQLALSVTEPRLSSLLASGDYLNVPQRLPVGRGPDNSASRSRPFPAGGLFGNFEIVFVPRRGQVVTLEAASTTTDGDSFILLGSADVRGLVQTGVQTAILDGALFRIRAARVGGGLLIVGTSLSQVTGTTSQVEAIVILGSIAVVLVIGLGVFAVVRRGLRPIEAMARQADAITVGDLTGRVAAHDPRSEVGRLGTALNGMLGRIEASQQQMRRFFGDASHELRTPLASLRANAQLYQQGALQDHDDVDEVMGRIVQETRRMGRLVDDMLGLAQLGQQPCQSREPVDLTAMLAECVERAQIAGSAQAWHVEIAEGLTVTGDHELLRRAVDNLLMNVQVHTPAGTVAAINASAAGDRVTIEVSDDGPGVPAEHRSHIFERFYRTEARVGGSGSGLGLAIVAETASVHGGTAQAAPVSPHGLRITLTLPARPTAAPPRS